MSQPPLLIVVLAAGKGVRMRSDVPKVLHAIAGRSMLGHVLAAAGGIGAAKIALVLAPGMAAVRAEAMKAAPGIEVFEQATQGGTAHAVLAARGALERHRGDVMVLYADTPLVEASTLQRLVGVLGGEAHIGLLGFEAADATGYGRVLLDDKGYVRAIREHRDATEEERRVGLCIGGGMAFRVPDLVGLLSRIGSHNAQGEFYLTDVVAVAAAEGLMTKPVACAEEEALGINSREQLAQAEAAFQRRARRRVMEEGATLVAPETVWLSYDTRIGRDVIIDPNVFFGPGVVVEDGARIMANCHMVETHVGKGARVGPFARFRPGADIGEGARVGNFVEVKNARLESGAKANHLAYIGDGRVGEGANIGAGTIFCNYDGYNKHFTDVGKNAFVGSNASLVAPVKIGDGAYIGSGSVISRNVEADALAIERSTQVQRPGWAARFRALMGKRKKPAGS
jgi:bifunctional UDP-N-acetylglucosamine pyrophosphorylase / glucosamine-1-phosphate N-acetyltransferase